MKIDTIIVDNFYDNPDEVRESALNKHWTKMDNTKG